jgi:hypothetical protein
MRQEINSTQKNKALEEIRIAQSEIAIEMDSDDLPRSGRLKLEQATLQLRNLERALVNSMGKELLESLKRETLSLNELTKEMEKTSKRLFKITGTLQKIGKISGRVIDIMNLVK